MINHACSQRSSNIRIYSDTVSSPLYIITLTAFFLGMAEVLGTAASVVQMVGLAVKIIAIGFSVRTLYLEMQGASATIGASLDDIHIVAQILENLDNLPGTSHILFRTARSHCEKCLHELQVTLYTMDNKIRSSRGFASKVARLSFVLRKKDIAKMEKRLETSLGLLLSTVQLAMLTSHGRLEQPIESQRPPFRTSYASFATRSCITLGEPYLPTASQLNHMGLLPVTRGH